jgi:hypothetical protein
MVKMETGAGPRPEVLQKQVQVLKSLGASSRTIAAAESAVVAASKSGKK